MFINIFYERIFDRGNIICFYIEMIQVFLLISSPDDPG